ncbi:MAG: hypothetical protein DWQ10_01595 [Calditrichaeota bacterium]|nr:MAG: hypothetical protein DWQ10_01595 [Calditrichota bacterium]
MIKKSLVLYLLVFMYSCTEQTPLPLSTDENAGEIKTVNFLANEDFTSGPVMGNSGLSRYLYLGNVDGKQCAILMRFDNIPDSSEIISARLELISNDSIIVNTMPFDAVIYKSPQQFESLEVTSEVFPWNSWSEEMARATVSIADTDTVVFDLDKNWVQTWQDSTNNQGLVIATDAMDLARRFGSTSDAAVSPVLNLVYKMEAETENDTVLLVPTADTFIYQDGPELPDGPLYISTIDEYRTILRFDLSNIPDNATINEAELFLSIDSSNSFLTSEGMIINAYRLDDDGNDPFTVAIDSSFSLDSDIGILPGDTTSVFDLSFIVQQWTRQDTSSYDNYGLILFPRVKYNIFARVAFLNPDAEATKVPKLKIHYTIPPSYE